MSNTLDVKILFIDDDDDVKEVAEEFIKNEYGYKRFKTSSSVEEANETFKNEHFDVLIIDIIFKGASRGFELLELGDENNKLASNMIIFTANDNINDCRKAFKMGAWDYIPKNSYDNPYEEIHKSIQESIEHTEKWGNDKDSHWINDNVDDVTKKYKGKYIAVMDNEVIASSDTKEELKKDMKDSNQPSIIPLIVKVD